MARRHVHRAQVVTRFVRIPEEIADGKVRCNGCGKVVALNKNGSTRMHNTPAGEPCAYRVVYARPVELDEVPPIVIPPQRGGDGPRPRTPVEREPTRLDVGSNCRECGRWLPGEREYCGKCANAREAARREQAKMERKSRGKS